MFLIRICAVPVVIFVALVAFAGACQPSTGPIRIGAIYNLEGSQSSLDVPSANGARLAVKEINASGGIRRRAVELVLYDGKTDRQTIEEAARSLVERDKVTVVIGFSDSDMVLYAAPITAAAGSVFLTSGATSPTLPQRVKDLLFLAAFSDDAQAEAAAVYAFSTMKLKTAYLLYDSSMEYTVMLRDHFKARYKELGGTVVVEDNYRSGNKDLSGQIGRLKREVNSPEMLYIASGPDHVGPVVKQFREAGFSQPIFGGDAYDTPRLREIAGPHADNVFFTTHALMDEQAGPDRVKKFIAAYRAEYGRPPENAFAVLGYDAVNLVAEAIWTGRGDDPRSILVGLGLTDNFPGVTGKIGYEMGRRIPRKEITIVGLKNGRPTLAAQVSPPKRGSPFFPGHVH